MSSSSELFERAQAVIPGGVNSPVRACQSVDAAPIFVTQGDGAYLTSADGKRYIDLVSSWGPLILGHAHSEVLDAVAEAMGSGTTYGAPTELEVRFAEALCDAVPSLEKVRAVSSGTEATMSAVRLARGFTKRDKLIKVDGGYHGHADFLLVAAGSGAATLGIPGSAGVTAGSAQDTILVPYNDLDAIGTILSTRGSEIAAVIIEPVAGNMGVVPPKPGYLEGLRELTATHGTLLIFDEVITGFRVAYGGAQAYYGVTPDLTCLGKIIGGGLPAAAFGGRADIMAALAPDGEVYQAGTLSGNPLAMAAGLATLEILKRPNTYLRLDQVGAALEEGLARAAMSAGQDVWINRVGSALTMFFCRGPVHNYEAAKRADTKRFAAFYRGMRDQGIWLAPSQFEAVFASLALSNSDVSQVAAAANEVFKTL